MHRAGTEASPAGLHVHPEEKPARSRTLSLRPDPTWPLSPHPELDTPPSSILLKSHTPPHPGAGEAGVAWHAPCDPPPPGHWFLPTPILCCALRPGGHGHHSGRRCAVLPGPGRGPLSPRVGTGRGGHRSAASLMCRAPAAACLSSPRAP